MAWAAAIAAGGSILGGLIGSSAQKRANETNIMLQREQRDWEKMMSDTSYRRAVADMTAAGLNPMLAYSQGGASTPSVSAATVEPEDAMGKGIASAADKASQVILMRNAKLQGDLTEQNVEQQKIITNNMARKYGTSIEGQDDMFTVEMNEIRAKSDLARSTADIKEIERAILEETKGAQVSSAQDRARILEKEVDIAELKSVLMRLDIPEKKAMADWFDQVGSASPAAKAVMSIASWLKYMFGR